MSMGVGGMSTCCPPMRVMTGVPMYRPAANATSAGSGGRRAVPENMAFVRAYWDHVPSAARIGTPAHDMETDVPFNQSATVDPVGSNVIPDAYRSIYSRSWTPISGWVTTHAVMAVGLLQR